MAEAVYDASVTVSNKNCHMYFSKETFWWDSIALLLSTLFIHCKASRGPGALYTSTRESSDFLQLSFVPY
jgi:hypothetical protein